MNINVGTKMSLIPESPEYHIEAFYVGEINGKHIVLTFSCKDTKNMESVKRLDTVKVQYFENDVRYEFISRIIERLEEPVDLIVLEYPAGIYSIDKRSLDRINCLVSVKLKNQTDIDTPQVVGVIENINKTGCLCNLTKTDDNNELFSMDDQVELRCQFPGLLGEQSAEGSIVRIHEQGKELVLGIHFDKEIWWVPPYEKK